MLRLWIYGTFLITDPFDLLIKGRVACYAILERCFDDLSAAITTHLIYSSFGDMIYNLL